MKAGVDPKSSQHVVDKLQLFAELAEAGESDIANLLEVATYKKLPAGLMTSHQGGHSHAFPLVLDGTARVFTVGEGGRELTLYRLVPGGACAMAAMSILGNRPSAASAVTETDSEVLLVSSSVLRQWLDRHEYWRSYVFGLISKRLASIITVTSQAAFSRMDTRVATYLLDAAKDDDRVSASHREIAIELGSSREVISRILKSFEMEGTLSLARRRIVLLDRSQLLEHAQTA